MKKLIFLIVLMFLFLASTFAQVMTLTHVYSGDSVTLSVDRIALIREAGQFTSVVTDSPNARFVVNESISTIRSAIGACLVDVNLPGGERISIGAWDIERVDRSPSGNAVVTTRPPRRIRYVTTDQFYVFAVKYAACYSSSTYVPDPGVMNLLYVSPNGDNATAEKGNPIKPWADPWTARSSATSGDMVYILPGTYNAPGSGDIYKEGVNYYAEDGAVLNFSSGNFMEAQGSPTLGSKFLGKAVINQNGSGSRIFQVGSGATNSARIYLQCKTYKVNATSDDLMFRRTNSNIYIEMDTLLINQSDRLINTSGSTPAQNDTMVMKIGHLEYPNNYTVSESVLELECGENGYYDISIGNLLYNNTAGGGSQAFFLIDASGAGPDNGLNVSIDVKNAVVQHTGAFCVAIANAAPVTLTNSNIKINFDNFSGNIGSGSVIGGGAGIGSGSSVTVSGNYTVTTSSNFFGGSAWPISSGANTGTFNFRNLWVNQSGSGTGLDISGTAQTNIENSDISVGSAVAAINIVQAGNNVFIKNTSVKNTGGAAIQSPSSITVNVAGAFDQNTIVLDPDVTYSRLPEYGSVAGTDTNFGNSNLSVTANRSHDGGAFNVGFSNINRLDWFLNDGLFASNSGNSFMFQWNDLAGKGNLILRADEIQLLPDEGDTVNPGSLQWMEATANGSDYISIKAPANLSAPTEMEWPDALGAVDEVLAVQALGGKLYWKVDAVSSDRRLKEDIRPSGYGLQDVLKLKPVQFKYKQGAQPSVGFIAQEIEAAGLKEVFEVRRDRYYLHMDRFIPILTSAIQDQNAQIMRLQTENTKLMISVESLRKKLLDLETRLSKLDKKTRKKDISNQ